MKNGVVSVTIGSNGGVPDLIGLDFQVNLLIKIVSGSLKKIQTIQQQI